MRIVAGQAKGHTLKTPKGMKTRPTQDRVRESIFNVLANYGFAGAEILDLFAGTGALGLEAVSRGAVSLVSVDRQTGRLIRENSEICHMEAQTEILPLTVQAAAKKLAGRSFDYIFADPPYLQSMIEVTIANVVEYKLLKAHGILVLEHHKDEAVQLPDGWACIKAQSFGYTRVSYCVQDELKGAM